MQDARLFKTPGHKSKSTDIHLWKLYSKEYYNKKSEERVRIYKCPMAHRCKCTARCRVIIGQKSIRLEFHGTHDETSHATEKCERKKHKILNHQQIVAIHEAVIIAPNQSALKLRRNLLNASPEKHIDPELLRNMQRRVRKARTELTLRELSVSGKVPESLGELTEWCESMSLELHLQRHNNPEDEYCLPLHQAFVLGHDIKSERGLIHFCLSSLHLSLNALRGIETGWGNQMNGDASFGFCRVNVDMICLGFNSMGCVNNHHLESRVLVYNSASFRRRIDIHRYILCTPKGCDITSQGQY